MFIYNLSSIHHFSDRTLKFSAQINEQAFNYFKGREKLYTLLI